MSFPRNRVMLSSRDRKVVPTTPGMSTSLFHMDECKDPHCADLEQLKELQKSIDHFTDYEHYERCCDGHVHATSCLNPCCDQDHVCLDAGMECDKRSCESYDEDCDQCAEEHTDCYEEIDVCEDDCEQCEEECEERGHTPDVCPQDHPTTRDNCEPTYEMPLPLLGPTNDFDMHGLNLQVLPDLLPDMTPCTVECHVPVQLATKPIQPFMPEPVFDLAMDHWQTFAQTHHCAPDPCIVDHSPQFDIPRHVDPAFGFSFGCDPSISANQYPWQHQQPQQIPRCSVPPPTCVQIPKPINDVPPAISQASTPIQQTTTVSSPISEPPERICQWLMPCGSICGASYPGTESLKKHVKNSHGLKGTTTCRWQGCTASFASEAALTGHISKKHLSPTKDESGPWKCTVAGCTKSFMYKQVRDEHVSSHNGGNKMHCPICHQWLNAEGSNFRRHMASHGPKAEHMKCRFEGLGCRRRFPRLDNLRRHESCCKFGKKAAGVHHHHHHVHVGHST